MMRGRSARLCLIILLICAVSIGLGQVLAKKKPKPNDPPICPTGAPGCFCPTYYAPVACQTDSGLNCIYSNQCFAGCAGFSPGDCNPIGPGPVEF
jgi:hypothetical protein